ncbi:MAG: hypothetical protein JO013_04555 [Alphaproteobacteria bacterium]|nr:hypothetical protein [Alphaproteobacteria bacterium]
MIAASPPSAPPPGFTADPTWFPFFLDLEADALTWVRIEAEALRAASFLDQRALTPAAPRRTTAWRDAATLPAGARRDAQYIFHIGHVGSTLLSRLLGERPDVLALREPLILRAFAEALRDGRWGSGEASRLDTLTALLSRTFRPEQRALIKATSFTSEIADRLLPGGSRALFLTVTPRAYIETILGGDASRRELALLTPSRLRRLARRCPGLALDPDRLSEAQKAAVGWACETTSLARAGAALGEERVLWIDFDRFLARPAETLVRAGAFLDHSLELRDAEALCSGPLMRRYSKALEYEYSPALRSEVLADARRRFGRDIDAALADLAAMGQRWPAMAAVLERS